MDSSYLSTSHTTCAQTCSLLPLLPAQRHCNAEQAAVNGIHLLFMRIGGSFGWEAKATQSIPCLSSNAKETSC